MDIGLETVVVNLAYAVYLSASLFNGIIALRAMLVLSSIGFIVFGAVIGVPSIVAWNALFGAFNLWKLLRAAASDVGSALWSGAESGNRDHVVVEM